MKVLLIIGPILGLLALILVVWLLCARFKRRKAMKDSEYQPIDDPLADDYINSMNINSVELKKTE